MDVSLRPYSANLINKNELMETLKQRILEHIADLLDEPTFELDMRLADCIDPLLSDKSKLHLMIAEASFKVFCTYFNKHDNTEQYDIYSVVVPKGTLCGNCEDETDKTKPYCGNCGCLIKDYE